jgi:hypothetical protein
LQETTSKKVIPSNSTGLEKQEEIIVLKTQFCEIKGPLTIEHILPEPAETRTFPTTRFRVCQSCNSGKGGRRLYEWKGLRAKDEIPRIAEGKYRKLLYDLHDKHGTLNVDKKEPGRTMCPACDLKPRCIEAGTVEKLKADFPKGAFQ